MRSWTRSYRVQVCGGGAGRQGPLGGRSESRRAHLPPIPRRDDGHGRRGFPRHPHRRHAQPLHHRPAYRHRQQGRHHDLARPLRGHPARRQGLRGGRVPGPGCLDPAERSAARDYRGELPRLVLLPRDCADGVEDCPRPSGRQLLVGGRPGPEPRHAELSGRRPGVAHLREVPRRPGRGHRGRLHRAAAGHVAGPADDAEGALAADERGGQRGQERRHQHVRVGLGGRGGVGTGAGGGAGGGRSGRSVPAAGGHREACHRGRGR
mmetsp:Transcript_8637/g.25481  ORF Transcript_8637/g.25481 Transcript_8637/m.25481 type:complete len:264 (-) Transcript_8637:1154-1945(-)